MPSLIIPLMILLAEFQFLSIVKLVATVLFFFFLTTTEVLQTDITKW